MAIIRSFGFLVLFCNVIILAMESCHNIPLTDVLIKEWNKEIIKFLHVERKCNIALNYQGITNFKFIGRKSSDQMKICRECAPLIAYGETIHLSTCVLRITNDPEYLIFYNSLRSFCPNIEFSVYSNQNQLYVQEKKNTSITQESITCSTDDGSVDDTIYNSFQYEGKQIIAKWNVENHLSQVVFDQKCQLTLWNIHHVMFMQSAVGKESYCNDCIAPTRVWHRIGVPNCEVTINYDDVAAVYNYKYKIQQMDAALAELCASEAIGDIDTTEEFTDSTYIRQDVPFATLRSLQGSTNKLIAISEWISAKAATIVTCLTVFSGI